jgi:hypothetical protein
MGMLIAMAQARDCASQKEMPMPKEHWKTKPEVRDFPAAANYLSQLLPETAVSATVAALRAAPLSHGQAKDLLRASALPTLGHRNVRVRKDLAKVKKGRKLSPVLLVRGSLASGVPLTVADGHHRICASHHLDEDAEIPYRIVDLG